MPSASKRLLKTASRPSADTTHSPRPSKKALCTLSATRAPCPSSPRRTSTRSITSRTSPSSFTVSRSSMRTTVPFYLALKRTLLAAGQRRQYHHARAVGERLYVVDHIAHRVALHLHAAHRREGVPHPGVHQLQILVNLRLRAHRRARIAGVHLLLYGHRRRQPVYVIHIGLRHAAQKLARVGAHALHVATLPFGKERVEGEARLATAAQSRHHHKLALRQRDVYILQVIGPRTLDLYIHNSPPACHFTLNSTSLVRLPSCVYSAMAPSARTMPRTKA